MTYYRIMQYCIANGMSPAKADYMRKLIRQLVRQQGTTTWHVPARSAAYTPLTAATIRECERQMKAVERQLAEVLPYSDFRGLTEMLKERHHLACVPCAEGNEAFHGWHYALDGSAIKCPRTEEQ